MSKDYWNLLKECTTVEEVLNLKEDYENTVEKDLARLEEVDEELEKLYEERRKLKSNTDMVMHKDHFYVKLGKLCEGVVDDNS